MRRLLRRASMAIAVTAFFSGFAIGTAPGVAAAPIDGSSCSNQVRIIDVSSYQPNINWSLVARDGIAGAFIKATEGTWYASPTAASQRAGAAAAGLPYGGYDFARPTDDPVADAKYFVANGGAQGTLAPVLDLETNGYSEAQTVQWAVTWNNELYALTGRWATLYTGYYSWFNDSALANAFPNLWLAAYPLGYSAVANNSSCAVSSANENTGAWSGYGLWQFTSVGSIWGISGNVDVSTVTPHWWAEQTGASVSPPNSPGTNNRYPASTYGIGSSGTAVTNIQNALNFWDHAGLAVDGYYGPATEAAVASFQAHLGLKPDGVWGPSTRNAYNNFLTAMAYLAAHPPIVLPTPILHLGQHGTNVWRLQVTLNALHLHVPQHGYYLASTAKAVAALDNLCPGTHGWPGHQWTSHQNQCARFYLGLEHKAVAS